MSAFLDLLQANAIWLYIIAAFIILFAIKMLVDSRRQARTTLFTLEQEQAGERAFRAVLLMVGTMVVLLGILGINTFVAPARPPLTPVATRQAAAVYTPAIVLPTFTTVPTLTPASPTLTPTVAIQSPTATRGPQPSPAPPQPQPPPAEPTQSPAPTQGAPAGVNYPAPVLVAPTNGESKSSDRIQFRWDSGEVPAQLPAGQSYKIVVTYQDRDTKKDTEKIGCTAFSNIWSTTWLDARGRAADKTFSWFVQVVQVTDASGSCYNGAPLSPQSQVRTFLWP